MTSRVLVVCGAGASSTFLVHAMRREIASRDLQLTVEAVAVETLPGEAHGAALVLVAHHLEDRASDIRGMLPVTVRVEVLPAISTTGSGPVRAVEIAERALSEVSDASHTPHTPGGPHA